jgi:hypothetical protein
MKTWRGIIDLYSIFQNEQVVTAAGFCWQSGHFDSCQTNLRWMTDETNNSQAQQMTRYIDHSIPETGRFRNKRNRFYFVCWLIPRDLRQRCVSVKPGNALVCVADIATPFANAYKSLTQFGELPA